MSLKPIFSIFDFAKESIVAARKKWGIKPICTLADVANKSGLNIEQLENMPAKYDGHLDPHDQPRFIAVKSDLAQWEQSLVIAREFGRYAQDRRWNSMMLDRPWKWEMLTIAPDDIKQMISKLDIDARAHLLMTLCATGDDFRAFCKRHPEIFYKPFYTDIVVLFHLSKLRIKTWLSRLFRQFAFS
jgi:hypothetical protein